MQELNYECILNEGDMLMYTLVLTSADVSFADDVCDSEIVSVLQPLGGGRNQGHDWRELKANLNSDNVSACRRCLAMPRT